MQTKLHAMRFRENKNLCCHFMTFDSVGGGGSGSELWEYVGGVAPDNIDVNSNAGAGVTGIIASLPANTKLKLLLTALGADLSGAAHIDGNVLYFSGVGDSGGGGISAGNVYNDGAGNSVENLAVSLGGLRNLIEVTNGDDIADSVVHPDEIDEVVGNLTDGKSAQRTMHKDYHFFKVQLAGVDLFTAQVRDVDGFTLNDGAGGNKLFQIDLTGGITTNQRAVTAHATPAGQLKLLDADGTPFYVDAFIP